MATETDERDSHEKKQDTKRKAFKRAQDGLLSADRAGKWGDWVWPV
jgi:hypothetical protein